MKPVVLITAALALSLVACGDETTSDVAEGNATGEVLPGSVSDAMIPLDQLRSQPAADPEGASAAAASGNDDADDADDADNSAAVEPAPGPPPPAPAAAPTASAPATPQPRARATSSDVPPPPVSVLPSKTPSDD